MAIEKVEVIVTCDECGGDEYVELNSLTWARDDVKRELEALEWQVEYERHLCPECRTDREEDEGVDE